MSPTREQVQAIVALSALSKEETKQLINEWQPLVTDEEFEAMWGERTVLQ